MLRTAALAALAALATALLGSWSGVLAARGIVRVDDAVALAAATGGTLVAAWYALTATALALAQLVELGRRVPRVARGLRAAVGVAGAPVLRRAAAVGVGAGLALAALPASAGTAGDDAVPHDLRPGIGSLASPAPTPSADAATDEPPAEPSPGPAEVRTAQPSAEPTTAPAPADRAPPAERARRETSLSTVAPVADDSARSAPATADTTDRSAHVVRPGDSLWSIARAHLGPQATDTEVAAEWPRWYATNRAVIGADPHLIHPGQHLLAPEPKEQR